MKKWTRVGIIILLIGVSLLAGTVYRSNKTKSFGMSSVFGLAPNTWSLQREILGTNETEATYFLWAPREFRLEVRVTAVIVVYILDAEGISQWEEDGTVEPLWAFEETGQDIYTLQITERGKYLVLVYNPTNESVKYELNMTIYGIEKDLLYVSIAFTAAGLVFTAVSVIILRKPQKQSTTPE
jgi:hypothetical protein